MEREIDALLDGPVVIPALADWGQRVVGRDLSVVPGYREIEGREDPTWRPEYWAWREDVILVRNEVQRRYFDDPLFQIEEYDRCFGPQGDPCWWICMWLVVEEPRPDDESVELEAEKEGDEDIEVSIKPFILFAYQARIVYLVIAICRLPRKLDLFISKARGVGISYCILAAFLWAWFCKPWRVRFLSEKLEKADRSEDLDALFPKIDLFMDYLPVAFFPPGFHRVKRDLGGKKLRMAGMFKNPKTRGQLTAEATTGTSTRGGRGTASASDECAFQQHYRKTRATLTGTTRHRIDWSTESFDFGRQWWDTWHSAKRAAITARAEGRPPAAVVLELEWYEHPAQDEAWRQEALEVAKSDGNLEAFEVENLRNPLAGYGTYVYPMVNECPETIEWYDPDKMLFMSVDPGTSDMTAFVFWQKHWKNGQKVIRWLDLYQNNRLPAEFYAHVMTGVEPQEGDVCFREEYRRLFQGSREQYFMQWMASVHPDTIRLYGDPASKSLDTGASSFRARLVNQSRVLYERRGFDQRSLLILLPPEVIYKRNNHPDRRNALRHALLYSEFSKTDGGLELKESISLVRFGKETERTVHPPEPRHDRYTHPTSAAEFGMIFEDLRLTPEEFEAEQTRQKARERDDRGGRGESARSYTPTHRRRRHQDGVPDPSFFEELVVA